MAKITKGYCIWVVYAYLTTLMFTCTVCQEDFCSFTEDSPINITTFGILPSSKWSADGACRCSIRASSRQVIYLDLSVSLKFASSMSSIDERDNCDPMIMVMFTGGKSGLNQDRSVDFDVCPSIDDWMHRSQVALYPGQEIVVHIDNPDKDPLESMVTVDLVEADTVPGMTVECSQNERIVFETCPCGGPGWGVVPPGPATFDEQRRLAIGLSVAFIFLLIVAIIIVGVVFYRRRKAQKEGTNKDAVTVENMAYQGSKQSVNNSQQPPEKDARINYSPDPTLNLQLQKGHHTSRDSGLASSNEQPNDKRLPFMQPNPASSSLDNLTQMPENYPPLAGHGSQSSLDHPAQVEPIYTTRPGQQVSAMPNAGPRAGNPDFNPLVGHGSQGSLNHPRMYPGDEDVYAKPSKRPARTGSYDQLYVARAEEEKYHSAESLNASRVTIETDV